MPQDLMKFRRRFRAGEEAGPLMLELLNSVNSQPWMGKEARTCMVIDVTIPPFRVGDPIPDGIITVRHRPHGWPLRTADRARDGTLLDGQGNPLPEGQEAHILEFHVREEVDFNQLDFGEPIKDLT